MKVINEYKIENIQFEFACFISPNLKKLLDLVCKE